MQHGMRLAASAALTRPLEMFEKPPLVRRNAVAERSGGSYVMAMWLLVGMVNMNLKLVLDI